MILRNFFSIFFSLIVALLLDLHPLSAGNRHRFNTRQNKQQLNPKLAEHNAMRIAHAIRKQEDHGAAKSSLTHAAQYKREQQLHVMRAQRQAAQAQQEAQVAQQRAARWEEVERRAHGAPDALPYQVLDEGSVEEIVAYLSSNQLLHLAVHCIATGETHESIPDALYGPIVTYVNLKTRILTAFAQRTTVQPSAPTGGSIGDPLIIYGPTLSTMLLIAAIVYSFFELSE